MASDADRLLVELALKNHLVKPEEAQAALQEATPQRDAGAVLLAKGVVKQQHLDSLKKKVAKQLASGPAPASIQGERTEVFANTAPQPALGSGVGSSPAHDTGSDATQITTASPQSHAGSLAPPISNSIVFFGQIAVHKGMVSEADLEGALQRQAELERMGAKQRIGQILVARKKLTTTQVQEVLGFQEKFILACVPCNERWNVSGTANPSTSRCPKCGAALSPVGALQSIGVQGSVSRSMAQTLPPGHVVAGGQPPLPASGVQQSLGSMNATTLRKPSTPEDPAGLIGLTWKGHKVDKVLGKGGMGAVYLATQLSLNRPVALKVMLRGAQAKPEELARFVREARKALAKLNHPHILKVIDAELEQNGELAWFTMELVKGRSFKEALGSGKLPMDVGARMVAKLARAMHYAHQQGIIHRDLKPQNVMLEEDPTFEPPTLVPKILDFGLAKTIDTNTMNQLTQVGAFLGTPAYMAPEQAGGDPSAIDGRADVYALGAMLYEVMTGRPPFTGPNPLAVIKRVLAEAPVPPTKVFPGTMAILEPICLKALQKDPATRQQTAAELADEIEKALGPEKPAGAPAPAPAHDDKGGASKKSLFGRLFGG